MTRFDHRTCSECGLTHSGECENKHRKAARYAARKLLATQSCTEDALTECLYEFAKESVERLARAFAHSRDYDAEKLKEEIQELKNELEEHSHLIGGK